MNEELSKSLSDLNEDQVLNLVKKALDDGAGTMDILSACRAGMTQIGKRYESGEYYVSDLIMAGEIFKQAVQLLGGDAQKNAGGLRDKVVVGTVKGDVHDIGKDLVVGMLRANGYDVIDLGVDVPADVFIDTLEQSGARILGLSGLLTVAYDSMKDTMNRLTTKGLRTSIKVMVGGGAMTDKVREYIGADAMGADAQAAVSICDRWTTEV
ncbi:MAG: cobalamin-binding protein [Desulfobacteraceae bacterium]|nr:cobalamin-binding protein [Desulfobacteraceae bacterium]